VPCATSHWTAQYAQIHYILWSALHLTASLNPSVCHTALLLFTQHSCHVVVPATATLQELLFTLTDTTFKTCRLRCSSLSQWKHLQLNALNLKHYDHLKCAANVIYCPNLQLQHCSAATCCSVTQTQSWLVLCEFWRSEVSWDMKVCHVGKQFPVSHTVQCLHLKGSRNLNTLVFTHAACNTSTSLMLHPTYQVAPEVPSEQPWLPASSYHP
jgi:hypothetical protein